MVAPRKFRNVKERAAIRTEVYNKLEQLELSELDEAQIKQILDTFCQQTQGQTLQGTLDLNSINCTLTFFLPGRRIMQHYMKLTRKGQPPTEMMNE